MLDLELIQPMSHLRDVALDSIPGYDWCTNEHEGTRRYSCSIVSLRPHGLYPARLPCPLDSPGKSTGVGCHSLLQGLFPTQGWNPNLLCLLPCRWVLFLLKQKVDTQSI